MGERMSGIKRLSKDLSSMFKNVHLHLDSFVFLFNKYVNRNNSEIPVDEDEIKRIINLLAAQISSTYDGLGAHDKINRNFNEFYKILYKAALQKNRNMMVDPFDEQNRVNILHDVLSAKKIENP